MTHLCVPIMVRSLADALATAARAAEHGADLVEFRIDHFTDDLEALTRLIDESPLPCIITCRPTWEGGFYDGDEQKRISVIEHAGIPTKSGKSPAYIDVELAGYQVSANLRQKVGLVVDHDKQVRSITAGLILSSHDFKTRPADLLQKLHAMAAAPACRVAKVAWRARSLRDNIEVFEILMTRPKPMIALCMGEEGLPSRVLAGKFGALLTFAAIEKDAGTAPGQPTIRELKDLYRWDSITGSTKVYGVIGWPVGHSMSPAIHNPGFATVGHNGVYLPMPIPEAYEHFKATVGSWLDFAPLDFKGASVTIPHKENLLKFVEERQGEIEGLARLIGAANTLTVRDDGSLYASNSDYAGALDAVCAGLGITREGLQGKRVGVIGAGGAARAIVAGFAGHGATVVVYNRTLEKAQQLVELFTPEKLKGLAPGVSQPGKIVAMPQDKLADSCCEVFINCTPVGMYPKVDASPFPNLKEVIASGKAKCTVAVFDTIYNPLETLLLKDAREAGCITIPGTEMFVRQAAAQFELWTQKPAPVDVFRKVLHDRLTKR
jgi:3-dehydroquinate dehydratase / shikimate dehydrogenase